MWRFFFFTSLEDLEVKLLKEMDPFRPISPASLAFPRNCAIAEVAWSNPKPRDYAGFHERMKTHVKRLRAMGVPCAPPDPPGSARPDTLKEYKGK